MFDLDRFITDCRAALAEATPELAIREILERAVSDPAEVQAALGTPRQGELSLLHHTPELTVVNVVWVPGMTAPPHNHRMWALIGLYGGQEDNTFYRTGPGGLTVAGARQLVTRETTLLGTSIIHSVTNPLRTLTGAIHVYGGDFVNAPRSEWESGQERPYRAAWAQRIMAEANERWRAECLAAGVPPPS